MASETRMRSLTSSQQRLVRLMQTINFGRIDGLVVRNGQPVFAPPPRVFREFKFGGENAPRPEVAAGDFSLRSQVTDFLKNLSAMSDAEVETLEIRHGLPFRMIVGERVEP